MEIRILALDIATVTGMAFGIPGGEPEYNFHRMATKDSTDDEAVAEMIRWLNGLFKQYQPTHFYREATLPSSGMGKKTTHATSTRLISLHRAAGGVATLLGIPRNKRRDVYPQTHRKFFVGTARPENPKQATINRCKEMGWAPQDDNVADALAIWSFGCAELVPETALNMSPLFGPKGKPREPVEDTRLDDIPDIEF